MICRVGLVWTAEAIVLNVFVTFHLMSLKCCNKKTKKYHLATYLQFCINKSYQRKFHLVFYEPKIRFYNNATVFNEIYTDLGIA